MKIIALIGPSSCGKTETLNILHSLLVAQGATSTNKQRITIGCTDDFSDVVLWNGNKIGIFSMGDYTCYLLEAILKYEKLKCDVFICACNDIRKNPQKEFARRNAVIVNKVKEPDSTLYHSANTRFAQIIIRNI